LVAVSTLGCYSRRQVSTSRLPAIQGIEGLQFVLIGDGEPVPKMWVMSEPKFEQDALSARFDRASEDLALYISTMRKNADYRANKNLVLIYLSPPMAKSLADTTTAQLDYQSIVKIEAFEPNAGQVVSSVLGGIVGGTALLFVAVLISLD